MKNIRRTSEQSKKRILSAAKRLILKNKGFHTLTSAKLSEELSISRGLILYYFKSLDDLKIHILKESIEQKNVKLFAYGLCFRPSISRKAPLDLKKKAIDFICK